MTGHEFLPPDDGTDIRLIENLGLLVEEQQEELLSQPSLPDNLTSRKAIFSWFKGTPEFQEIYREARQYLLEPRTDEDIKSLKTYIAGDSFQEIAYACTSRNLPEGLVLLSPEKTNKFYGMLFPNAQVQRHPLGLDSLADISVPDGLLIATTNVAKIVRVVEYTLEGKPDYFEKKFNAFTIDKYKFLPLFGQSSLLFVTPTFRQQPSLPPAWKAKIRQLPFSHHQFRNFSNWVYGHYRQYENIHIQDDSSATLKEFQEEARYQGGRR